MGESSEERQPANSEEDHIGIRKTSTVLVLGSSGLLGSNLSIALRRNMNVRNVGVSRTDSATTSQIVPSYDPTVLEELFGRHNPSVVINCVGVVGHDKVEHDHQTAKEINVDFPKSLAEITSRHGIRLVHFSSDSVYSGNPSLAPFSEQSDAHPFSLYGSQKLESEKMVQNFNPDSLVLRVNFFGWSQDGQSGMLDHFASHALKGLSPIGYSKYIVTSLYVGDLAEVVLKALHAGLRGTHNVGSSDSLSKYEFGRVFFSLIGMPADQVLPGNPSIWAKDGTAARDLSMSSLGIEESLGIKLPSQESGIRRALEELREHLEIFSPTLQDSRAKLVARQGTK